MLNGILAFAQFSGSGSGTKDDPYLIYNPIQLYQLRNAPTKYYKLMADIDMTDFLKENDPTQGWQPVGTKTEPFKGVFNGNNHKITGLFINKPDDNYIGFFGVLRGDVYDLTLEFSQVVGNDYVGTLAGYFANAVRTTSKYIKSISSSITSSNGIKGNRYIGGIIGYIDKGDISTSNDYCNIDDVSFSGNVTGTGVGIGGIIGIVSNSYHITIQNVKAQGNVESQGNSVGGICGYLYGGSVDNSSFSGYVKGNQNVGGVCGQGEANKCYVEADIYGTYYVGGVCGKIAKTTGVPFGNVVDNFYLGNICATSDEVGGIVGYIEGPSSGTLSLSRCVAVANIIGQSNVGGIVGTLMRECSNCFFSGMVSASNQNAGGINGRTISNGSNLDYRQKVKNCLVLGPKIMGRDKASGIGSDSDPINCVVCVDEVESSKQTAYRICDTGGTNCLALSTMRIIQDNIVCNTPDNGTSTFRTLLKLKATYVALGWDFENVWTIQETESYPYLNTQTAPPYLESQLTCGATTISGKTVDDGTVFVKYNNGDTFNSVSSNNHQWSYTTSPLVAGSPVRIYAKSESLLPSYVLYETTKYNGKGTEAEPYMISTAEELANIYSDGYYKIAKDIDLSSWITANSPTAGWIAAGNMCSIKVDGDGHKISGLWTNSTSSLFTGLFGNLLEGSELMNINVSVNEAKCVLGWTYCGALVAHINGSVNNCHVTNGNVSGTKYVGGVIGLSKTGTISKSSYTGTVSSVTTDALVGGVVGQLASGKIEQCQSQVTINATATGSRVGGLVGRNDGIVSECVSKGSVNASATTSYTGGLVGLNNSTIQNCFSIATTDGTQYTGGLVGYSFGTIDKTYAIGNLKGINYGGGVVGELDGTSASITNSVAMNNRMDLTAGSSWAGRIMGGYKNNAPEPESNNYALATMQVSLNNVPKIIYDDPVEGIAKTEAELKTASFYSSLGWDMTNTWDISEGTSYPYLRMTDNVVTVSVTSISLNKTVANLNVGGSVTLIASVSPTNATNKNLEWSSSSTNVATVADGVVTAVAAGTATITVKSKDGSNISATCTVTVTASEADTDISSLENVIYISNIETNKGNDVELSVKLKNNTVDVTAFSFNLVLPEGFSVKKVARGTRTKVLDDDDEYIFTFASSDKPGMKYVQAYNMQNAILNGKDGEIAKITISVPESVSAGDYPIIITDGEISYGSSYVLNERVKSTLTVKTYIVGDANGDGRVSITDVSTIAGYLLGNTPEQFSAAGADVNVDGRISITDVSTLASLLLAQ